MQHKMRFQNERGVDSATTVELQGETIKVSRQRAGDNGGKSSYLTIHEAMALVVLLTRAIEDRDTGYVAGTPDWAKPTHDPAHDAGGETATTAGRAE